MNWKHKLRIERHEVHRYSSTLDKIRFAIFTFVWLVKNRDWQTTRQKCKRLEKDWIQHEMKKERIK